jgi:hypothetical protein
MAKVCRRRVMTDKAKIKTITKYHELYMPDGRFWRFEYLPDLLKFAKENGIDIKMPPRKIEEE